jgi:hypothetical protein
LWKQAAREIFDRVSHHIQAPVSEGVDEVKFSIEYLNLFYNYFSKNLFINRQKEKYILIIYF